MLIVVVTRCLICIQYIYFLPISNGYSRISILGVWSHIRKNTLYILCRDKVGYRQNDLHRVTSCASLCTSENRCTMYYSNSIIIWWNIHRLHAVWRYVRAVDESPFICTLCQLRSITEKERKGNTYREREINDKRWRSFYYFSLNESSLTRTIELLRGQSRINIIVSTKFIGFRYIVIQDRRYN